MSKRELTKEEKHELLTSRFTAPFKVEVTGHFELTEKQKKKMRNGKKSLKDDMEKTKYKDKDIDWIYV